MQPAGYHNRDVPSQANVDAWYWSEFSQQGDAAQADPVGLTAGLTVGTGPHHIYQYTNPPHPSESKIAQRYVEALQVLNQVRDATRIESQQRKIKELFQTAHQENWDGEGASRLSKGNEKCRSRARRCVSPQCSG